MTFHYPDLGSAFDWLKEISLAALPIENTGQIWVVTHHQYGISLGLFLRSHFAGKLLVVPRNVSSFLRLVNLYCPKVTHLSHGKLYCSTMLSVSQSNSFLNVFFSLQWFTDKENIWREPDSVVSNKHRCQRLVSGSWENLDRTHLDPADSPSELAPPPLSPLRIGSLSNKDGAYSSTNGMWYFFSGFQFFRSVVTFQVQSSSIQSPRDYYVQLGSVQRGINWPIVTSV